MVLWSGGDAAHGLPLWHVVQISFHPKTPESVRHELFGKCKELGEVCGGKSAGILYYHADWNLDQRKDVHIFETAIFSNESALCNFQLHRKHREFTDLLQNYADWWVCDKFAPLPTI